jgi:hypothetical protein
LQLPEGAKVRIIDLPGLAYVGDQGNANVIQQCREALCIVTYNSAETDSQRVKILLQEVVQQVRGLGGSPARMLFALNRIDVFRADNTWPESENDFVEKAIRDIKNELTERLTEYTEEIEKLEVIKLSPWPALLSRQIQNQDDICSAKYCQKARQHFYVLIEDILEDLPHNTQNWNRHEKNRVAEALWQKSYAEEFNQYLIKHINQNFPQLVIPQIIERFNIAAGNSIAEWANQTTTAILNSSEERYQKECENLLHIKSKLQNFLDTSDKHLKRAFEQLDTQVNQVLENQVKHEPLYYIKTVIYDILKISPYNQLGEKLDPLFNWNIEFKQAIQKVLEAVAKSLETGIVNLNIPYLQNVDNSHIKLLSKNLERLIKLGYTDLVAKEGKII